jgi:predicted RNA-binding Zn-ribbon protein involved in translation (DUF1610 family)
MATSLPMRTVECSNCGVRSDVPEEARAYRCPNCGREQRITASGDAVDATRWIVALIAVVVGVALGLLVAGTWDF